jgi:protein O-mannosyl-transferase
VNANSKFSDIAIWTLIAGVVLAFGRAAYFGFITFDDGAYVFLNQQVLRGLTPEGIASAFSLEVAGNWHPLTMLAYMGVSSVFGPRAWAYHFLNVALHAANSVLLFKLLETLLARGRRRSPGDPGEQPQSHTTVACWFGAATFALHPLRVESVVWISELKDLLCALFFLLTIRAYLIWTEEPTRRGYLITMAFFAAGLMSKPMLVTLPCVLLLLDYWPLRRLGALTDVRRVGALTLEKLPLFALSVAACLLTIQYQKMGDAVRSLEAFPFTMRVQSAVIAYAAYLGKLVWPIDLAVFYPYPDSWPLLAVVAATVVVLILTLAAVVMARKVPAWFTAWFWYLGTLVPVIGFVQVGQQSMADRYTYIPSMGISLFIAFAADFVRERLGVRRLGTRVLTLTALLVIAALSFLTWRQVGRWRSSETLYRHALLVTGDNWFMRQSLAVILAHTGRVDEGIEHLQEALRIDPQNAGVWDDLGYLLQLKGAIPESIGALERAIQIDPRRAGAHRILAAILRQKGQTQQAIEHLNAAIRVAPKDLQSLVDLARLRASHPDASVRNAVEAVKLARAACEHSNYQSVDALDALAASYAEAQQFDLAMEFAQKGIQAADSSGNKNLADRIRRRASLYELRLPLREAK